VARHLRLDLLGPAGLIGGAAVAAVGHILVTARDLLYAFLDGALRVLFWFTVCVALLLLSGCRVPDASLSAGAAGVSVAEPPAAPGSPPPFGPGATLLPGGVPPRPPAPARDLIPARAVDLIIAFEVGSPEVYDAKYRHPTWPGGASGVTVGIGYDLGHTAPRVIALDWEAHPHAVRLAGASGTTGPLARELARRMADIAIEYGYARQVFDQTSLVEHYRIARRVFGANHFDALPPPAQGALVSLVFNRGGAMAGERRREMRVIRDDCLPRGDTHCIATQLRAMARLWAGTDIEAGMRRRREAEAALATTT
jgi:GH24 family phage-related lysozyme (muramidase)